MNRITYRHLPAERQAVLAAESAVAAGEALLRAPPDDAVARSLDDAQRHHQHPIVHDLMQIS